MGLAYRIIRQYCYPAILCDQCGEVINDGQAVVLFQSEEEPLVEGSYLPVRFVHKGDCHDDFERAHGWLGWEELVRWYLHLRDSAGLTKGEIEAAEGRR
jgi:hypothetical protein